MLAGRPPSTNSQEDALTEEDALLTGRRNPNASSANSTFYARWREIGIFLWAFLATIAVIVLAVVFQHSQAQHSSHHKHQHDGRPGGKRNLIFMVSDGMGPSSLSLTRSWRQFVDGLPIDDTLVLDQHLIGQSRTRSSSSLVTDSAAGATAFSCGLKSYNGAISVTPDGAPCGSLMEAAKRAGYTTGLVVTTRITDATPAVWASHARHREYEDDIAEQMVGLGPMGRSVDLMLGGGRCHFLSNDTTGSCRDDELDLVGAAQKKGWNYISSREDFDGLDIGAAADLPLMGLFATGDIPFEIDRRHEKELYPSLEEMARTALKALSAATKDSEQGFFIMIEGSRVDHAGHHNDPAAQVHEVLAYDRTIQAVLDFLEEDDVPGVMISTSDHETGGLATARQLNPLVYPEHYLWYPSVLANASLSTERTARIYRQHLATIVNQDQQPTTEADKTTIRTYLTALLGSSLGIHDVTTTELDAIISHNPIYAVWFFSDMISRRAQIGWSSHGHTAADVNIYASDKHAAKKLQGNHENIEVGAFLRWYLDLEKEVEDVTKEVRHKLKLRGDVKPESVGVVDGYLNSMVMGAQMRDMPEEVAKVLGY